MVRQAADGAVAQLGERWLCKPEVVGSIPISSTIHSHALGHVSRGTLLPLLLDN